MLLALLQGLVVLELFGALVGILLGIDMLHFDALAVEDPAFGLRVLGRHGIAVVAFAVLVHPAVIGGVFSAATRGCQARHKPAAATIDRPFLMPITVLSSGGPGVASLKPNCPRSARKGK